MTQWYSFADPESGRFDATQRQLREDQVASNTPAGMVAIPGEHDPRRSRIVMVQSEDGEGLVPSVVSCEPERPMDTELSMWVWSESLADWVEQPTAARLARDARTRRDELMASADWVTLRALRTSTPVPADWAAYLQALADLPQQPGFPTAIDWPTPPAT